MSNPFMTTEEGQRRTRNGAVQLPGRLPWWLFLITAALWIVIAWSILRFNLRSVATIAALAGVVILIAAAGEIMHAFSVPSWRWLHAALAVLFAITGFVALIHPGNTFVWLAAFIGWYLLFKGIADIILAFATKASNDGWWLSLIVGIFEITAGFWAAGRFGRSAYLLIVLVAAIAISRAITDTTTAFRLRNPVAIHT